MQELAELKVQPKRLWRATKRIGEERAAEHQAAAAAYCQLPIPQRWQSPTGVKVEEAVCVQADGGRYQVRDRCPIEGSPQPGSCWREMKVGCLASLKSGSSSVDPCAELPPAFADPGRLREMAREIKGFTTEDSAEASAADASTERTDAAAERSGLPQVCVKSVVATAGDIHVFGPLLASAAHARGFAAAQRKAFLGDGSETIWSLWRQYFSHYTPIVDFVHALMYVYAAAMAGCTLQDGWKQYRDWAQWLWSGSVEKIIVALRLRHELLGHPAPHEQGTPRAQIADTLRYLENQRERMHYAAYRQQGLPITTALIESTIKQVNRRIKGSEKFWADGVEGMLNLVADHLSQTPEVADFWRRRSERIQKCYQAAA